VCIGLQASGAPSPDTPNDTKSTYFAAMTYFRKTLFGCGPKLIAVYLKNPDAVHFISWELTENYIMQTCCGDIK